MIKVIDSIAEMQKISDSARSDGKRIALVPTMGYLHAGHASLMVEGRKHADILVTSIFVNPTQFGPGEDLDKYPRNLEGDLQVAESAGVDIVFTPKTIEMYPQGYQTYVNTELISLPLCGGSRPGHFRGVTTVVAKLFGIIQPHTALFGNKDFQQLAIIRQMTADLNIPVEIIGMPIVREPDGLAMSSRNTYLNAELRKDALCLKAAIDLVTSRYRGGEIAAATLKGHVAKLISKVASATVDYIEFCDSKTLQQVETVTDTTLMALAVKIGSTRLIDNMILGGEQR